MAKIIFTFAVNNAISQLTGKYITLLYHVYTSYKTYIILSDFTVLPWSSMRGILTPLLKTAEVATCMCVLMKEAVF